MTNIDILLHGIPGRSSQGYLGQASSALINERTVIDVGSLARRPLLEKSFDNVAVTPEEVEHVLLTHVHFDHCDNIDLFPNATLHVYGPELDRVKNGNLDWATPRQAAEMLGAREVERFDAGDRVLEFEVVPAPGHTEHHVAFFLDADLTYAFTGDAVKNTRELVTMDPMVLYDKEAAIDTLRRVRDRADFIVPGHDTPFHVDDGNPIPSMDTDFGVNLQVSPGASVTADLSSDRSKVRELPDAVNDVTARQEYH